jgi:hypothetical protein
MLYGESAGKHRCVKSKFLETLEPAYGCGDLTHTSGQACMLGSVLDAAQLTTGDTITA